MRSTRSDLNGPDKLAFGKTQVWICVHLSGNQLLKKHFVHPKQKTGTVSGFANSVAVPEFEQNLGTKPGYCLKGVLLERRSGPVATDA